MNTQPRLYLRVECYLYAIPDRHHHLIIFPRSQTFYGSLVETFGPYFQDYTSHAL